MPMQGRWHSGINELGLTHSKGHRFELDIHSSACGFALPNLDAMDLLAHSKHFHEVICSIQLKIGGRLLLLPRNFRFQIPLPASFYLQIRPFFKQFKPFVFYFGDSSILILLGIRPIYLVIEWETGNFCSDFGILGSPLNFILCKLVGPSVGCIPLLHRSRVEIKSSRLPNLLALI